MLLYDVADALARSKVPFAVAGGYAVALHGAVRGTVDVDIVLCLTKKDFISAEAALRGLGLTPRLPVTAAEVFDFREEYIRDRNLVAWSFVDGRDPTRIVDIVITHDLAKMRSTRVGAGGRRIPVLSVPDLIAMKKRSGRPQDLEDIRALKELHP
ncbi:MAG: nucleotidyl transferase AbiEii/AbiGii toxin family protein [Elusimicrobia bacterium]|nr:nucleotidyl transferase AbiEii/AbiGii toxin family protein [Elusimicrobiota bacterium]